MSKAEKCAPAGGQQVTRGTSVNMTELPDFPMDILGQNGLHRRITGVIKAGENGLGTISRHREPASVVRVALRQCLGKRHWWVIFIHSLSLRIESRG